MQSKATPLVLVYEAGPCGDWLYRYLTKKGYECWVVAPSLIPHKAGDRVNTARRDAVPLARLARAGALTPSLSPRWTMKPCAISPGREDTLSDRKDATFRLTALWLRHAIRDTGRATGNPAHLRWLAEVVCPPPAPHIVFQESVRAVTEHTERLQRLDQALHARVTAWRLRPVVDARQAWRGVQCTVAVTRVAARGDLTRCDTPRALMKCLGLLPSEDATAERHRQGSITTAGNTHARRALVEGAWAYRHPANVSRHLQRRLEHLPKVIQDISWKAQVRLCQRFRRLVSRGKPAHVVTVAIARELVGVMWAIAKQVPAAK
jgi:transposase